MSSDLDFLEEMLQRFREYRDGNLVQGDYVEKMITDWIDELEQASQQDDSTNEE